MWKQLARWALRREQQAQAEALTNLWVAVDSARICAEQVTVADNLPPSKFKKAALEHLDNALVGVDELSLLITPE